MREDQAYISPIWREQADNEALADVCKEILQNAKNELYLSMRFLDVSLNSLSLAPGGIVSGVGTDGACLYFEPRAVAYLYRRNRIYVNRIYLHSLFHCLFVHLWNRGNRAEEYWNLACDIAVESLIDGLKKPCVHLPMTPVRREYYSLLGERARVLNAESVYKALQEMELSEAEYERLRNEFYRDDHALWEKKDNPPSMNRPRNKKEDWDEKRARMQMAMEAGDDKDSADDEGLRDRLAVENRERYDYKRFLRKFSVMKETVQVDPDAFDYVFYHYGMELYGNMPLIEPLETKELRRVEDFVIVVDTSMSCSGELVRRFLEETYGVLSQSETYFKKVNIHIIQCDDKVREDVKIESGEELASYMENMELKGLGGTDFRPAFLYVNQLLKEQRFKQLKGLLYFTDGKGTYPVKMPPYDTAFVFLRNNFTDADVPPWAMKVLLDEDQLMGMGEVSYEY